MMKRFFYFSLKGFLENSPFFMVFLSKTEFLIQWGVLSKSRGRMKGFVFFVFLVGTILSFLSCVSVNLGSKHSEKAKNIHYSYTPDGAFVKWSSPGTDESWRSSKSGNVIAYTTECNMENDVPISVLQKENFDALNTVKVVSNEKMKFLSREAQYSIVEGELDGVNVKMALLLFKRDECNYNIQFVGRSSGFDSEFHVFTKFYESFKVP